MSKERPGWSLKLMKEISKKKKQRIKAYQNN